jgi:hypothetical protein
MPRFPPWPLPFDEATSPSAPLRAYKVKAAKTNAPINTATANVIKARRNLAMQTNMQLAVWFGLVSGGLHQPD